MFMVQLMTKKACQISQINYWVYLSDKKFFLKKKKSRRYFSATYYIGSSNISYVSATTVLQWNFDEV